MAPARPIPTTLCYVVIRISPIPTTPDVASVLRVLASPRRLKILEWLRDPVSHFPPQRDGDLVKDGVCVIFIAQRLGVAQPSATVHLQALSRVGLVTSKRVGQWTFYKRNEPVIRAFKRALREEL